MSRNGLERDIIRREKVCSYCDRSFARTEHLTRHERSHRNERPFSCTECHLTFTRKDVFKRHHLRHHSQNPSLSISNEGLKSQLSEVQRPQPTELGQAQSSEEAEHEFRDNSNALASFGTEPLFQINDSIEAYFSDLDFSAVAQNDFFNLEGLPNDDNSIETAYGPSSIECPATTGPLAGGRKEPNWRGSFALSKVKRDQLATEMERIRNMTGKTSSGHFPSCFSFERLLNAFSEFFLINIPCIHIPTWKAEAAPPCLLFVMASIGASYYEDTTAANDLFFTARYSLMNYLESSPLTIATEPLPFIQCLLFVMSHGIKSADFKTFQDSLSLSSLLATAIRYRNLPLPASANVDLLDEWQDWIEYESIVRTNYAIYVFLCTLSINFEVPNALLDSDMKDCYLPCDEEVWLSPTPQNWLAVRRYDSKPPIRFSDAMRELHSPQCRPAVALTSFGGYVTLHALVKQLGSLSQGPIWLASVAPTLLNSLELALEKWRISSEKDLEYPFFPRYPQGVLVINSVSLYRQAHVRLCGEFGPLRSAMATQDVQEILLAMNSINFPITRTKTCLKAARCAVDALRTPIRMGMALLGKVPGWYQKLLFNLYSIECCIFSSLWVREVTGYAEINRTLEEQELVNLVMETLREMNLTSVHAQKPFAAQLVYAWALIFERCNATKVQGILAEALNAYASTL